VVGFDLFIQTLHDVFCEQPLKHLVQLQKISDQNSIRFILIVASY
jgi:hypothetical protein